MSTINQITNKSLTGYFRGIFGPELATFHEGKWFDSCGQLLPSTVKIYATEFEAVRGKFIKKKKFIKNGLTRSELSAKDDL